MFTVARVNYLPSGFGLDDEPARELDVDSLALDHSIRQLDAHVLAERRTVLPPPIQYGIVMLQLLVQ